MGLAVVVGGRKQAVETPAEGALALSVPEEAVPEVIGHTFALQAGMFISATLIISAAVVAAVTMEVVAPPTGAVAVDRAILTHR